MHTDDPVLDLMDRFTAALNCHPLRSWIAIMPVGPGQAFWSAVVLH